MPKLTKNDVLKKAEELKNWGKWGPDDQLGVLNYITPQDIVNAARLVKRGKVFRLGLELDENGPQRGIFGGRWNPLHQMLATGTDAVQGKHDVTPGLRYADDAINLPTQAATQWDALSHVFLGEQMWNGYPATLVDSRGAHKNGIEKFASKMVGRGVLLDVARHKGVPFLQDGYGITVADLDATAKKEGVEVRRADFVIIRTGAGLREPGLDPRQADRRDLQRYLGDRGPSERHRAGGLPALALGDDSRHRDRARGDLLSERAGRGLRRRRLVRVLLLRPAARDQPRDGLAHQSPGHQVGGQVLQSDIEAHVISEYWGRENLAEAILAALKARGTDLDALTTDELAPVDQFHGGGKPITVRLARLAIAGPGMRVLDVGGGFGGPARTLAVEFGCHVTVVDLTESYVRAARMLTARMGLDDRVSHHVGNALDLTFPDGAFDMVWTQNSGMNIADKERLYAGFHRVLRPGGLLALQEPMAGPAQPLVYPVMWARDPSTNFLRAPAEMKALIERAGFTARVWDDVTAETAGPSSGAAIPAHSIQRLVMGDAIDEIIRAGHRNRAEGRLVSVQAVFDRP